MKSRRVYSTLIALFLVASMGLLSAQTPVMGKIYTSDYNAVIPDASITVSCGSNSLSTISLNDGAYVVRFDPEYCAFPGSVSVEASKGNLKGSDSGSLIECDGINCTGDHFSIVNLALKIPGQSQSIASGGSKAYLGHYNCGNNKCDSGESIKTCPKDCIPPSQNTANINLAINGLPNQDNSDSGNDNSNGNENPEIITQENTSKGIFNGITGAAVSISKTRTGMALGFLIVAIAIIIFVLLKKEI